MENESGNQPVGYKSPPKDTQFGGKRANPQSQDAGGNKPWSVKNSIRYLSHHEFDENDTELDEKGFVKKLIPKKFTGPQMQAARVIAKGMLGDLGAIAFTTEQIDGKVANMNLNAELAQIMTKTDEQIDAEINEYYEKRQPIAADSNTPADESQGTAGDGTPGTGG